MRVFFFVVFEKKKQGKEGVHKQKDLIIILNFFFIRLFSNSSQTIGPKGLMFFRV